ncbi:hypothetical protein ACFVH9_20590 [Streptomyces hirsutus]|uniref:hypothetical protein n=1 Tax=Streptomyces hirsutus TaxID=35620 RepID=UPI0036356778
MPEQPSEEPTEKNDPAWTFSRFDPDEVEPVGDVRVRGRLTFEPLRGTAGKVVVKADYTFVYAVAPADGDDEVTRSIVCRMLEVDVADPAGFQVTDGRIRPLAVESEIVNDDCRNGDGVIRPQFFTDRPDGPTPTGRPGTRTTGARGYAEPIRAAAPSPAPDANLVQGVRTRPWRAGPCSGGRAPALLRLHRSLWFGPDRTCPAGRPRASPEPAVLLGDRTAVPCRPVTRPERGPATHGTIRTSHRSGEPRVVLSGPPLADTDTGTNGAIPVPVTRRTGEKKCVRLSL